MQYVVNLPLDNLQVHVNIYTRKKVRNLLVCFYTEFQRQRKSPFKLGYLFSVGIESFEIRYTHSYTALLKIFKGKHLPRISIYITHFDNRWNVPIPRIFVEQ